MAYSNATPTESRTPHEIESDRTVLASPPNPPTNIVTTTRMHPTYNKISAIILFLIVFDFVFIT